MKKIISLLLLIIPFCCYSQKTYMIVGIIKGSAPAKSQIDGTYDFYLENGTTVIISGTIRDRNSKQYEIYNKNKKLYIDESFLLLTPESVSLLENLSTPEIDTLRIKSAYYAESIYKKDIQKAQYFINKTKTQGITITNWSYYDES